MILLERSCREPFLRLPRAVLAKRLGGRAGQHVPGQKRDDQDWINASKSLLIVSACVVGIPCGKPVYVFSVPFCTSLTVRGPEVSWGTTWSASPFMARTGTLIFFRSSD
ncbi:MAG: hypothetical protein ACRDP7_41820 [Trebonia sp.]